MLDSTFITGGAQAQLTAARLVADQVVNDSQLHVYAFGAPRVGDVDFAVSYDKVSNLITI